MLDVADRIDHDATEKPKNILLNYIFTGANFITLNLFFFIFFARISFPYLKYGIS